MTVPTTINGFAALGLPESLVKAVEMLGYTEPTPIQSQAIPVLLAGQDILGQANTGTGKTGAFALPLLANIQLNRRAPQILVLTPTRELALQVAEAFNTFAVNLPGIGILPIYGGQGYSTQLTMLRRGVHIIVGTPGRVMDHMRSGALNLENIKTIILDEADEMLRMGFAEDVEWILQQVPGKRQFGLFSATMPPAIKAIAEKYLDNPQRITVKTKTTTAATIRQCFLMVSGPQKLDALTRVLETEESDAVIVFVKTKRATEEVAEQLTTRGFNAVAINGDIVQKQRERVIEQLKNGRVKILIATDVAARGIDVERVTHVINYDAPNNPESYVHRIGRTGRAGRTGTAIIFISPRDKFLLRNIERETKQVIEQLETPSVKTINERRIATFKQSITEAMTKDLGVYQKLLNEYVTETNASPIDVAAALAKMLQGNKEFLMNKAPSIMTEFRESGRDRSRGSDYERRRGFDSAERSDRGAERKRSFSSDRSDDSSDRRRSFGADRADRPARTVRATTGASERPGFDRRRSAGADTERRTFGFDNDRRRSPADAERGRGRFESDRGSRPEGNRAGPEGRFSRERSSTGARPSFSGDHNMEQYRVDIGRDDGLLPKNLVGAIANTAGIEGRSIGKIKIESRFSLVDLPKGMSKDVLLTLQRLKVSGKQMNLKKVKS